MSNFRHFLVVAVMLSTLLCLRLWIFQSRACPARIIPLVMEEALRDLFLEISPRS